jgi:hypothetical protein
LIEGEKMQAYSEEDFLLLELLKEYIYIDLGFIMKYIYSNHTKYSTQRRLEKLQYRDNVIRNFKRVKSKRKQIISPIYTLSEEGYKLVLNKEDFVNIEKHCPKNLRRNYEHNILMLHILYEYKTASKKVLAFSERQCYQKIGEKAWDVVRPDGAIITDKGMLILFEFENTFSKDYFVKLRRYNNYFLKKLYKYNFYFMEYEIKYAMLCIVSPENRLDYLKEKLINYSFEYVISYANLDDLLTNPLNSDNFLILYQ